MEKKVMNFFVPQFAVWYAFVTNTGDFFVRSAYTELSKIK